MKTVLKISLVFILITMLFSCQSKSEEINNKSNDIFTGAITDIKMSGNKMNTDSLMDIYTKTSSDNAEMGLHYAKQIQDMATEIKDSMKVIQDSIAKVAQVSIDKANAIAQKKWDNSKAGKIQKKHPEWTAEECQNLADRKIWIGMSFDMLKYQRGNPNSANPSNYGSGTNWQWCWDDYSPSCFYGGSDGIVTSYN